jgi:SAM-dependent methyltransferase
MQHTQPMDDGSENLQKVQVLQLHSLEAEKFAQRYSVQSRDPYHDCFAYSRRRLDALLDKYLPQSGESRRLLDVGCGTGHHLRALGERGYAVTGVDAAEGMLEHARSNNPGVDIRCADVDHLPFEASTFDYVICLEVLRYLSDPSPAIREIGRVLRPGGSALVTASPAWSLNAYWLVNRLSTRFKVPGLSRTRQFFTTSPELRRQFGNAGFSHVEVHGVYIGAVNWVERIAPRMLSRFLQWWEPIDRALADRPGLRETANMFLVRAVR